MQMNMPIDFTEVNGHESWIKFLEDRIAYGTLTQCILWYGNEGVGKTLIAKITAKALNCQSTYKKPCNECDMCKSITENVLLKTGKTENVLVFNMSSDDKGIKATQEALTYMNTSMLEKGVRVIILDECHRMCYEAQDMLLTATNRLPPNVYVFACTTDLSRLQKSFLSRFYTIPLGNLSNKDMVKTLKKEVDRRSLVIDNESAMLSLIAEWCEGKPRQGLKVIEALGKDIRVSTEELKSMISYLDVKAIIPVVTSFSGSFLIGINTIRNLQYNVNTQQSLIGLLVEVVTVAKGGRSKILSHEDYSLVKEAVKEESLKTYAKFLYYVADTREFNKNSLMVAYLRCHSALEDIMVNNDEILKNEIQTKAMRASENTIAQDSKLGIGREISGWEDMLRGGTIIGESRE